MQLEQEITAWDGKSAADIKAIYAAHHAEPEFTDKLVELAQTTECEKGATWLLKAWLEAGNLLEQSQIKKIYEALPNLEHWEARLHLLQCIPFMPIADAEKSNLYDFLMITLGDPNKFLRAWAYNGLYELSRQHSEYQNDSKQLFQMAMRDEAPSVKARIRNIARNGF